MNAGDSIKPNWFRTNWFLYAVITIAALVLNWQFVLTTSLATVPESNGADHISIWNGYLKHPRFLGGFSFWHGPWINDGSMRFRPLASHFHWLQCWTADQISWRLVGVPLWVAYSAFCCGLAALIKRLTGSHWAALIAGIVATASTWYNPDQPLGWLAVYQTGDFMLALAFFAWAVVAWDAWLTTPTRGHLIAALVLPALAMLSKEFALILPALYAVMVWHRGRVAKIQTWGMVAAVTGILGGIYAYGTTVVPPFPRHVPWVKIWQDTVLLNPVALPIIGGQWVPLLLSAAIIAAVAWWARCRPAPGVFFRAAAIIAGALVIAGMIIAPESLWDLAIRWQLHAQTSQRLLWFAWCLYLAFAFREVRTSWALLGCLQFIFAGQLRFTDAFFYTIAFYVWGACHIVLLWWATWRVIRSVAVDYNLPEIKLGRRVSVDPTPQAVTS